MCTNNCAQPEGHFNVLGWDPVCLVQGPNSWISRKSIRERASSLFGRGSERPKNVSCSRATPDLHRCNLGVALEQETILGLSGPRPKRLLALSLMDFRGNPGIWALYQANGIPSLGGILSNHPNQNQKNNKLSNEKVHCRKVSATFSRSLKCSNFQGKCKNAIFSRTVFANEKTHLRPTLNTAKWSWRAALKSFHSLLFSAHRLVHCWCTFNLGAL